MQLKVECYAGHRGEQEPRVFFIGDRRVAITEIVDRWLSPEHRYFKVKTDDAATYILRHDEASGNWEMTLFQTQSRG